jgi:hypothetical protein
VSGRQRPDSVPLADGDRLEHGVVQVRSGPMACFIAADAVTGPAGEWADSLARS